MNADVAQLAEQLICNQQVIGSSPIIGFLDLQLSWLEQPAHNRSVLGSSPRRSIKSNISLAQWLSWLERRPVTAEVTGSSPVWVVGSTNKHSLIRCFCFQNLGSQLSWESICLTSRGSQVRALQAPFPLFTLLFICAVVAELADARDLKSRGQKYPYRFDPGLRQNEKPLIFKGFFMSGTSCTLPEPLEIISISVQNRF